MHLYEDYDFVCDLTYKTPDYFFNYNNTGML